MLKLKQQDVEGLLECIQAESHGKGFKVEELWLGMWDEYDIKIDVPEKFTDKEILIFASNVIPKMNIICPKNSINGSWSVSFYRNDIHLTFYEMGETFDFDFREYPDYFFC